MKFVCERCQTKYSIADEKVRQKVLKIRCKTCENVITIRDAVVVSEPAVVRSEPPPTPAQAPRSVEWHLAISGQQSGPFGLSALVSRIAAAGRNDEIYVWNEHLDGWKEPRLIPEVAAEMRLRAASLEPPAPPAAARRTLTPMAGHSQLPRGGSPAPAAAMRGGRSGAMAAAAKLQPEESADAIFEEKTQISPLDASVMLGGTEARPQTGRGLGISAHGARPEIRRPESRTTEHAPTESRRTEAKPAGKSDGTAGKARDKAAEPKPVNKTFEETKPADLKHPADLGMASLLSVLPASNGQGARKTTGAATAAASGLEALDFAPPLVAPSSQPAIDFPAAARNGVPTPVVGGNTSMLLAQVGAKASKPRHPAVKYGIVGLLAVGLVGVIVVVATSDGDKKPTVKAENTTSPVAAAPDPEAAARAEAEKYFKSMVGEAPAATPPPSTKSVGPAPTPRRAPSRRSAPEPAPIALAPPPVNTGGAGDSQRITQRFAAEERRVAVPTSTRGGRAAEDFDISKFMAVFKQPDHHGAIKSCYERALKRDANLKLARLDINVTVGETGSAKKVRIDAPSEFNAVSSCIRDSVRRWRFPATQREYEAAFPLILQGGSE